MLKIARGLSIAVFFCYPLHNAQAALNKCTDGKQITYTTESCEKAGLSPAGPIKDAVTVMPLVPKTQNDPSGKTGQGQENAKASKNNASYDEDPDAAVPRETTIKPVNPLVNKMLKW
jgi:hypothetical protein